jgi:hypothetical protein
MRARGPGSWDYDGRSKSLRGRGPAAFSGASFEADNILIGITERAGVPQFGTANRSRAGFAGSCL